MLHFQLLVRFSPPYFLLIYLILLTNELSYAFSNHLTDNIIYTYSYMPSILPNISIPCICISKPIPYYFYDFCIISIFTIYYLIPKSSYSCFSYPINQAAFKQLNSSISPYILDITNLSIHDVMCATSFNHAIIIPILKKPLFDPNIITNYCHIY